MCKFKHETYAYIISPKEPLIGITYMYGMVGVLTTKKALHAVRCVCCVVLHSFIRVLSVHRNS